METAIRRKYPKTEKRIAQVGEYVTNGYYIGRVDKLNGEFAEGVFVAYRDGSKAPMLGKAYSWRLASIYVFTGKSALKAKIADLEMQLQAKAATLVQPGGRTVPYVTRSAHEALRTELDSVRKAYDELRSAAAVYVRRSDYDRQVKRAAEAEALAGSRGTILAVANQDLGNARDRGDKLRAKLDEEHKVNGRLAGELGRLRAAVKDARKDIVSTVDRTLTGAVTGPKDEEPRYYTCIGFTYRVLNGSVTMWNWTGEWRPSGTFASEADLVKGKAIRLPGGPVGVA